MARRIKTTSKGAYWISAHYFAEYRTYYIGPFVTRERAEEALVGVAARSEVQDARITYDDTTEVE